MADRRDGRDRMTIAAHETIKARGDAEAAVEHARNLVTDLLTERGEVTMSECLEYLTDHGVHSDSVISDALMGLVTTHDVDLDENRRLRRGS